MDPGPVKVCFRVTGPTGYLALELPKVYNIKGDDHTVKATLKTDGSVSSFDVRKNFYTPVGEGSSGDGTTLLELTATDGPTATGTANAYPAVAAVNVGQPGRAGSRACTGTLVDPNWVLTAASCFAADPTAGFTVPAGPPAVASTATIGRADLATSGGHTVAITELVPRTDRDLVMARLAAPVTDVTPLTVATAAPVQGETLRVAGYGRTKTEWVPNKLHTATFNVDAVKATGVDITGVSPAGTSVCQGDTGAPTIRETGGTPKIAAVASTSWQNGCLGSTETAHNGAFNTRTDDVYDWVQQTRALATGWKTEVLVKSGTSLYQGIRLTDGSLTGFGDVESKVGSIGGVKSAAAAGINGDTHVVAVGSDGHIRHTIRSANGSWSNWGDVNSVAGWLGSATQVSAVSIGTDLHVIVLANGIVFHTVRHADGNWTGFGDVSGAAGGLGSATSVATASVAGQLQLAAVSGGKIFHTIRNSAGSWTSWGDVSTYLGAPGPVSSITMAGVGGETHVVIATANGTHQYHALRKSDGTWENFADLGGLLGQVTAKSLSATAVDGEVQLALVTDDNKILHIIRHADRTWSTVAPVETTGVNGTRDAVAITGTL
ncbi:hypothetical protein GCM10018781_60830 [Kitasatospora indigofera]|uniref:Peptidase S1 domain-containing protein n=1 Tax=Kitasatospora indigofera TaxID=67307 RepID=A0A919L2J2_9ACTN|nr:trypsin-like serine protease [Kitasatospora indigofera]GHH80456.1 hypothetical protein GCM10018781_60830 [Kitasatospora indigofera]